MYSSYVYKILERERFYFIPCCRYLYYFERGNQHITSSVIQGLIELIVTEMQSENATQDPIVDTFLANTLRYIRFQKQKGDDMAERYAAIEV